MQLTAAAVTPPAEHAARRPAGAADAAAADAGVRRTTLEHTRRRRMSVVLSEMYVLKSEKAAEFTPLLNKFIQDHQGGKWDNNRR